MMRTRNDQGREPDRHHEAHGGPDRLVWHPIFPRGIREHEPFRPREHIRQGRGWLHWLVVLTLLATAAWLALSYHTEMSVFLSNMTRIGPGHPPEDQVKGLIAFGLIGVTLVAIVRILRDHQGSRY